jgi:hypothetical protein
MSCGGAFSRPLQHGEIRELLPDRAVRLVLSKGRAVRGRPLRARQQGISGGARSIYVVMAHREGGPASSILVRARRRALSSTKKSSAGAGDLRALRVPVASRVGAEGQGFKSPWRARPGGSTSRPARSAVPVLLDRTIAY